MEGQLPFGFETNEHCEGNRFKGSVVPGRLVHNRTSIGALETMSVTQVHIDATDVNFSVNRSEFLSERTLDVSRVVCRSRFRTCVGLFEETDF